MAARAALTPGRFALSPACPSPARLRALPTGAPQAVRAKSLLSTRTSSEAPGTPRSDSPGGNEMFTMARWIGRNLAKPGRALLGSIRSVSARAKEPAGDFGEDSGMWMIVGLGNPGKQYQNTRHNIGFDVLDALGQAEGIHIDRKEHKSLVGRGRISDTKVILVKPQTYMNDSGKAVSAIARYYKIPLERVLVVYDDMDSDVATLKVKKNGGHGGHNGIRSIIACMGNSKEFPRVRFGVGRPEGNTPVVAHVLTRFDKKVQPDVDVTTQQAIEAVRSILTLGLARAMSTQPWSSMNKVK